MPYLISMDERREMKLLFEKLFAARSPAKSDAFNRAIEKAASALADDIIKRDRYDINQYIKAKEA